MPTKMLRRAPAVRRLLDIFREHPTALESIDFFRQAEEAGASRSQTIAAEKGAVAKSAVDWACATFT